MYWLKRRKIWRGKVISFLSYSRFPETAERRSPPLLSCSCMWHIISPSCFLRAQLLVRQQLWDVRKFQVKKDNSWWCSCGVNVIAYYSVYCLSSLIQQQSDNCYVHSRKSLLKPTFRQHKRCWPHLVLERWILCLHFRPFGLSILSVDVICYWRLFPWWPSSFWWLGLPCKCRQSIIPDHN